MKHSSYLIIFFVFVTHSFVYAQKKTIIAGKIENFDKNHLLITFDKREALPFKDHQQDIEIPVRKDGTFFFKTTIENFNFRVHPHFSNMDIGWRPTPVSLMPEDSLYVTFDARQLDQTLKYSGKGAAKNNFWAKLYNKPKDNTSYLQMRKEGADAFLKWTQKTRQDNIDLLREFSMDGIENEFLTTEKSQIDIHFYNELLLYTDSMQTVPATYKKIFEKIDLTDENIFKLRREDFLKNFINYYTKKSGEDHFYASKKALKGINRDYYVSKIIYNSILKGDLTKSGNYLKDFSTFCLNPLYLSFLNSEYDRITKLIAGFENGTLFKREKDSLTITGFIKKYELHKKIGTIRLSYKQGETQSQQKINDDGSFLVRLPNDHQKDVYLVFDNVRQNLICSPGAHLYIEFDPGEYTASPSFFGDLASDNMIFQELQKFKIQNRLNLSHQEIKDLEPEAYKTYCLGKYSEQQKSIAQFFKNNNYTGIVMDWANWDIMYNCAFSLCSYQRLKRIRTKSKNTISLPDNYFDFIDKFPLDNEKALITSHYKDYIKEYFNAFRLMQDQRAEVDIAQIKNLDKILPEENALIKKIEVDKYVPSTRAEKEIYYNLRSRVLFSNLTSALITQWSGFALDFALYNLFTQAIDSKNISSLRDNIEKFKLNEKNAAWRQEIIAQYEELDSNFKNPVVNTDVVLNVSQKNGEEIIDELRKKYAGKIIYLDFWATWCKPCLARMTISKELHEKYKDKIVFVYLCMDSKEPIWKATLAKIQQPGSHYFLNKNQDIYFDDKFQIKSIPHYVLIDKKGTIVNDNAPDPGWNGVINETLIKTFDELMN